MQALRLHTDVAAAVDRHLLVASGATGPKPPIVSQERRLGFLADDFPASFPAEDGKVGSRAAAAAAAKRPVLVRFESREAAAAAAAAASHATLHAGDEWWRLPAAGAARPLTLTAAGSRCRR